MPSPETAREIASPLRPYRNVLIRGVAIISLTTVCVSFAGLSFHLPQPVRKQMFVPRGRILSADGVVLAGNGHSGRVYPGGRLSGPLLGFMGKDGGLEGLEASQNDVLARGTDLHLTLDTRIESMAESQLQSAIQAHQAQSGSVVVLDTATGQVLALASASSEDLTAPAGSSPANWRDRAAASTFEPGSEMKALTVAALIDRGLATPNTVLDTPMRRKLPGATIHDAVPHPAHLTTAGVLRYSSNVGISRLVERLGPQGLHDALKSFGIGQGVRAFAVPAAAGRLNDWHRWGLLDAATNGFGQGITTTTLEFAAAFNTIANDGMYIAPSLLAGQQGTPHRVIQVTTARTVQHMLYRVVRDGIPQAARLPGYQLAGKTGTAQVVVNGRYSPDVYVSTFSAFFPAGHPRFTVSVMVRGAKLKYQGSELAAPLVRNIASELASVESLVPATPSSALASPLPFAQ
jgi:cell division protein FtsI (penicillin-binding protein 3)